MSYEPEETLEVIQSFPFEFYGDVFNAYLISDRQFYIRLNDLCDAMGLEKSSQRRRILQDEGLEGKLVEIVLDTPYRDSVRRQPVSCLNIRALPYWLGTIDAKRVNDNVRARVILFKRDFVESAWSVYRSEILPPELEAEIDTFSTPLEREAADLMAQFRTLKRKLDLVTGKTQEELDRLGLTVGRLDERFTALEARLIPEISINSQQARQISEMIKHVGKALFETKKYGKSEAYAVVQDDFKEQFQIHIYSALPADMMDDAIRYLRERWKRLKPGQAIPEIFRSGHQKSLF